MSSHYVMRIQNALFIFSLKWRYFFINLKLKYLQKKLFIFIFELSEKKEKSHISIDIHMKIKSNFLIYTLIRR